MKEEQMTVSSVSASVAVTRTLKELKIGDDIYVFQLTHETAFAKGAPKDLVARFKSTAEEGFATARSLAEYKKGKCGSIKTIPNLYLVPSGFLETARTCGFTAALESGRHLGKECVYQELAEGRAVADDVVQLAVGSHMIFDRNGGVLPTAIYFSYMNGRMKDGTYDLQKALEILKMNKNVILVPAKTGDIRDVPYYNASEGCSKFLEFRFCPTREDIKKLWEKMLSYGASFPSTKHHEAIFDLDMLGLRVGGAAKYENYYGG